MVQCGDVFMEYSKKTGVIRVRSQGYDSSYFNAKDFLKCIELLKEKK